MTARLDLDCALLNDGALRAAQHHGAIECRGFAPEVYEDLPDV
jgi:hypothetical protein